MRIVTDGAELGDLAVFSGGTTPSFVTNTTANASSGSRCYRFNSGIGVISVPSSGEYYVRTRLRPDSVGTANLQVLTWKNGPTFLGSIIVNSANNLVTTIPGSSGSSVFAGISSAQYALFETHIKIANVGGIIECAIDGILVFSFTGDTQPFTSTTIDNFQWGYTTAGNVAYNMDDIAINNTDGLNDNSWCGDGRIFMMNPVADGDVIQLSRGGTDTGANWSQVDEIPPDGDTTYVYSSGSGQYDFYNLSSGSSIVGVSDTISRIYVESRTRELSATGESIRLGILSSGSEYWSADIPVTTTYSRYEANTWATNPATGLPWTISDLDNLQAGVKVV